MAIVRRGVAILRQGFAVAIVRRAVAILRQGFAMATVPRMAFVYVCGDCVPLTVCGAIVCH